MRREEPMSEDNRESGGQLFGHIVVQTGIGEVFSLDLFETPDLVCQGFYFPPSAYHWRRQQELPNTPLLPTPEVELRASQEAVEELERTLDIQTNSERDRLYFEVYGDRFETYGALNRVSPRSEAGPEVWTGHVGDADMSFVLERYGSPDIIVLIVLIYLLVWADRRADELDGECWDKAVEMCGERRIKSYKVRRNLAGISANLDENLQVSGISANLGFGHDCEIECE
jgi:hypothetical protein